MFTYTFTCAFPYAFPYTYTFTFTYYGHVIHDTECGEPYLNSKSLIPNLMLTHYTPINPYSPGVN